MDKSGLSVRLTRWRFLSYFFVVFCCIPTLVFALGPYVDNRDGTVTDSGSGLMWQQSDRGTDPRTWEQAISNCEGLNLADHDDWRLPNIRELRSIVEPREINPSIDTKFFFCQGSYYWSSTTTIGNEFVNPYAWGVLFIGGANWVDSKDNSLNVRCVRGGQ